MPNLPFHIATAYRMSDLLGEEYIQNDKLGYCLFGSTVPDIRAMTKKPRGQTHFTELTVNEVGTGAANMFAMYPELLPQSDEPAMRAFLCGYLSHLICDETWITKMYRPHFSEENRKCSAMESNLWDRALQLQLDSEAVDLIGKYQLLIRLPKHVNDINLGFVSEKELTEWQTWVMGLTSRGFSWDRLYNAMRRMHRDEPEAEILVDNFIMDPESNLNVIHDYIETDILSWYVGNTVLRSVETIKRYIN